MPLDVEGIRMLASPTLVSIGALNRATGSHEYHFLCDSAKSWDMIWPETDVTVYCEFV